jgi:hypothetical protein
MRLAKPIYEWLARRAIYISGQRAPDFTIMNDDGPYLQRWWVIPRNKLFNIYLHIVVASDDDRALHDHPWLNCSIMLDGAYIEHRIAEGGVKTATVRRAGDVCFRRAKTAHRLELCGKMAMSLFLTAPRIRDWGFHCPDAGWRHWKDFTGGAKGERIGRGCGE